MRAVRAAVVCIRKFAGKLSSRPKVVLVSDTPSLLKDIGPNLVEFAEVSSLLLDYMPHFMLDEIPTWTQNCLFEPELDAQKISTERL